MYYFVERSVAIIKPKALFLNWVNNSFHDLEVKLTLDSIRVDCNSYLIPEIIEIEDGVNFIDEKFAELFAIELSSWTEDKTTWPQEEFSLKMFWEWFDVDIHPVTMDITELEADDIQNDDATVH
jgi:hypothetical protein